MIVSIKYINTCNYIDYSYKYKNTFQIREKTIVSNIFNSYPILSNNISFWSAQLDEDMFENSNFHFQLVILVLILEVIYLEKKWIVWMFFELKGKGKTIWMFFLVQRKGKKTKLKNFRCERKGNIVWIFYHLHRVPPANKVFHWKQHSQCNVHKFLQCSVMSSVKLNVISSVKFLSVSCLWKYGILFTRLLIIIWWKKQIC